MSASGPNPSNRGVCGEYPNKVKNTSMNTRDVLKRSLESVQKSTSPNAHGVRSRNNGHM